METSGPALAAVVERRANDIEQVNSFGSQPAIVVGAHRHADSQYPEQ
jgi:hypothetical protein